MFLGELGDIYLWRSEKHADPSLILIPLTGSGLEQTPN